MDNITRFIVMDTETVGLKTKHLLDIGYYLIELRNAKPKILKKFNYLVSDVIGNRYFMENDKFIDKEKYENYLDMLLNREIKKASFKHIMKMISRDIIKYKATILYAYNSSFDFGVFKSDCAYHSLENPFKDIQVIDIYALACSCILNTKEYYNWALENNQITNSGCYIATGVEPLTRYLNNDINFEEKHTALSDSYHELQILYKMIDMRVNIFCPYHKIKKFKTHVNRQERVQINNVIYTIDYSRTVTRKDRKVYYDSKLIKE